jgi:hypothetical protein
MSTIEEKKAMIPMNYYNEFNGENEYFKNMRFLGINYDGYPLMIFELANGKTVMRQLFDSSLRYELVEYK